MRIGFDAKRAFFNQSGFGNYSRDTISILAKYFPMNEYILYSPRPEKSVLFNKSPNLCISGPFSFVDKTLPSLWRTYGLAEQLKNEKIQLYHGLSNELPKSIEKTIIPSVVTFHDLIFLRYPQFYSSVDRKIYEMKYKYAAKNSTRIIAVSNQTKEDLMEFFKIPERKIEVVYQGCKPIFWERVDASKIYEVLMQYNVPEKFILFVGNIEERKNILNIIKALQKGRISVPMVIIGKATKYLEKLKAYIDYHQIRNIYFLNNVPTEDLPSFYQSATMFVYPSLFEGFGIPILEALTSKTPVITSIGGCFAEAGGKSSLYVDPENINEIEFAIKSVIENQALRDKMILDGFEHAQQFRHEIIALNMMHVYEKVL